MKAARLKGDLLSRKGAARPVPGVGARHSKPTGRPALAAVGPGTAEQSRGPALKRDEFGRVRLSLRLDPHRHLRLRLLAAHSETSLQETLIAALDAYLDDEAQNLTCDCLHGDCLYGDGEPSQDDETRAAGVAGIKGAE